MKIRLKMISALLTACTALLTLSACVKESSAAQTVPAGTSAAETAAVTESTTVAAAKAVTETGAEAETAHFGETVSSFPATQPGKHAEEETSAEGDEPDMLNINYSIGAKTVLYDPNIETMLDEIKAAGVDVLWLYCYFQGYYNATFEEMLQAKIILEARGFEVQAINVPLGHGATPYDKNDHSIDPSIGEGWSNRVDIDGNRLAGCACLNDKVIEDSKKVSLFLKELGITKVFYDDDLRLGHWGKEVRGCFCDSCIAQFNSLTGRHVSRVCLKMSINNPYKTCADEALIESWVNYNCDKIIRFLKETAVGGLTAGIMVMHNGDRRHGVDIARIRAEIPGILIRVGEGHFGDESFLHEDAAASLTASISTHLALAGDTGICYSESTVYPQSALSPENWIEKMRLEIKLGLRNIFLMDGTLYFPPAYWAALEEALPELESLAKNTPEPEHKPMEFIWQL